MATRNLLVELRLRAKNTATGVFDAFGRRLTGIKNTLTSLPALVSAAFGGVTLAGFVRGILNAGAQAEQLQTRFSALYGSIEKGQRKIDEIKAFGRLTIGTQNALAAALQLKQFGIEPLDGALQALVDQNAKLGGNQENLMEVARQLGQAWQKQKLQYEEILILMERGIPVLELLSSATGKSA
ncbi:MAG: tape measure protein, partial [Candidatus Competibacteraceae bacterium]|nr:tape measure protein [Candidatus Competibacteraceae bacterium]